MKKKERTLGEVLRATGNDMRSQLPGIAANTGRVYAGAGQALVKEAIRLPESFLRAGAFAGKAIGADPSLALASADVLKGARGGVDKIMAPVTDNFHGKAGHYLPLVAGAPGAVRGAVAGARALPKVVSKLRSMFPAKKVITKATTKKKDNLPKKKDSKKKDPKNKEFIPHPSVDDIGEKTVAGMTRNQKQVASEWQRQGYMKKDKHGNWKQTNKK